MGNSICVEDKPRDPITLADIDDHKFIFARKLPGGHTINAEYNISPLIDYFLASGDFVEPESRLDFSDDDLRRLDEQARKAGYKKPSVFEAKHNPSYFLELKLKRDAVIGIERLIGDVVTSMMSVVEKMNYEEGQIHLIMNLFPAFVDYYKQMEKLDKEFSQQSLLHYKLYLKGPPNRPTKDINGLLKSVLEFIDGIQKGKISNQDYGFSTYS
mmetsp:Transcript_40854/g.53827  ORF Transcript_40854/g.53827 Transcript_40854/m.53827 type:complete len:213 (+) Transcript_40854:130-768(+)|eukprot:CAMPEP_0117759338 /NCGR_PEP_ID=MMETSP0947-20121206/15955_1 /TAXON_ID=44440 /ORGANISM="Chattonella subsalsa, Strain CCMP2191" /LENGTH=212 /DNA_ID=CAMNT_0005579779 /DNA_START=102 /DNA_END=740 /DNA_ORIENTATION=+